MNKEFYDVKEFHKAFNHPHPDKPTLLTRERALTRKSWMDEELGEFIEATEDGDIVEQADAMIDVLYFAIGTLVEMGIEPEKLFAIVQEANMSKLFPDGKPHYRESDGKTIKPDTWEDPHEKLKAEIERQANR